MKQRVMFMIIMSLMDAKQQVLDTIVENLLYMLIVDMVGINLLLHH